MDAPNSGDWQWAHQLRDEQLGFAPFNVMAVFAALPAAQEAVASLRRAGLSNDQVSLRSRTVTDDPPAGRVEPAVEVPTRRRDAEVVGRVGRSLLVLSAATAAVGAILGLVIGLAAGFATSLVVITAVVGAVTGAVVGGVWGGEIGSMGEARKEEGVVVGAHSDDRASAARAEQVLRGLRPLRVDLYDGQGRPIPKL